MHTSVTAIYTARKRDGLYWILLLVAGAIPLLVFWGAVGADFVPWEDDINIYKNPHLRQSAMEAVGWAWSDGSYAGWYMPLGWMGWLVNYWVDGLSPATYHLVNILIHCANASLVFVMIHQLLLALPQKTLVTTRRRSWLTLSAGLAAVFWAVHPLRVEPVAWASGRLYAQALFFLLVSLVFYLRHAQSLTEPVERRGYYWVAVAAFGASLLTFPVALGAVAIYILLDVYPLGRWHYRHLSPDRNAVWKEKIPLLAVAGMAGTLTVWARATEWGAWSAAADMESFGVLERVLQGTHFLAHYLWRPWWPTSLTPVDTILIGLDPERWTSWAGLVMVLGISVAVWRVRSRAPGLVLGWIAYLALLLPLAGWFERPHYTPDRYGYLAGILWSVLLAGLLWKGLYANWKRVVASAACLTTLLLLSLMSRQQTGVWQDGETLFRHLIAVLGDDPLRHRMYHRLGHYYLDQNRYAEAEHCFEQELEIGGDHPSGFHSLGTTLAVQGKFDLAVPVFERLLTVAPDRQAGWLDLGRTLEALGRWEDAIDRYRSALNHLPQDLEILLALGRAYRVASRFQDAEDVLQRAWRAHPQSGEPPSLLATVYREQGDIARAVEVLRNAIASNSESTTVMLDLAWILATHESPDVRDTQSALALAVRAAELAEPSDGRALDTLAAAYAGADRFEDAVRVARRALEATAVRRERETIAARLREYVDGRALFLPTTTREERP